MISAFSIYYLILILMYNNNKNNKTIRVRSKGCQRQHIADALRVVF